MERKGKEEIGDAILNNQTTNNLFLYLFVYLSWRRNYLWSQFVEKEATFISIFETSRQFNRFLGLENRKENKSKNNEKTLELFLISVCTIFSPLSLSLHLFMYIFVCLFLLLFLSPSRFVCVAFYRYGCLFVAFCLFLSDALSLSLVRPFFDNVLFGSPSVFDVVDRLSFAFCLPLVSLSSLWASYCRVCSSASAAYRCSFSSLPRRTCGGPSAALSRRLRSRSRRECEWCLGRRPCRSRREAEEARPDSAAFATPFARDREGKALR